MHALYGLGATSAVTDPLVQAAAAAAFASSNRDTTLTKIFVGGLPYHTSDKTLHEYFEQFGEIEEAVVITDRQTQKSRGYGFVTMKDRAAAERACKDPNPIIDGRKANVNLAYLGAKPRGNIQLAALTNASMQLPLQTQLQALFPQRLGVQQLYFPQQAAMMNPLLGLNTPSTGQMQQIDYSQVHLQQAIAAALAAQGHSNVAAAAAAANSAASVNTTAALFHPAVSSATGLEQYTAAYSPYTGFHFPLQSAQLASAAAAQSLEHQRV